MNVGILDAVVIVQDQNIRIFDSFQIVAQTTGQDRRLRKFGRVQQGLYLAAGLGEEGLHGSHEVGEEYMVISPSVASRDSHELGRSLFWSQ